MGDGGRVGELDGLSDGDVKGISVGAAEIDGANDGEGLGTRERVGLDVGTIEGLIEIDGATVGNSVMFAKQKLHESGQASLIVRPA